MNNLEKLVELRKLTKAPISDCKESLVEANYDIAKAVIALNIKSIKKFDKLKGRSTFFKYIYPYTNISGEISISVILACESDAVKNNIKFKALAKSLAIQAMILTCNEEKSFNKKNLIKNELISSLLTQPSMINKNFTANDFIKILAVTFGENIKILEISILK